VYEQQLTLMGRIKLLEEDRDQSLSKQKSFAAAPPDSNTTNTDTNGNNSDSSSSEFNTAYDLLSRHEAQRQAAIGEQLTGLGVETQKTNAKIESLTAFIDSSPAAAASAESILEVLKRTVARTLSGAQGE
jgi:hypothetical protein